MYLINCFWSIDEVHKSFVGVACNKDNAIPVLLKRRLSTMGLNVLTTIKCCIESINEENLIWVISSRFGDTEKMISLFNSLYKKEQGSPTDFSMSVHNALIGISSIQQKNTQMHTAISAGDMSFSCGFVEAYSIASTKQQKIGYIYYDFPLPDIYDDIITNDKQKLVVAFIIDPATSAPIAQESISLEFSVEQNVSHSTLSQFINFLSGDQKKLDFFIPGGCLNLAKGKIANAN